MQDADLVDTSIFIFAYAAADKECDKGQEKATTEDAQEYDQLLFIIECRPV